MRISDWSSDVCSSDLRLLVHRRELDKLFGAVKREGVTLIPLKIYFNERGIAKLALGLARGKKKHDKREAQKEQDWRRQKSRQIRRASCRERVCQYVSIPEVAVNLKKKKQKKTK